MLQQDCIVYFSITYVGCKVGVRYFYFTMDINNTTFHNKGSLDLQKSVT